MHPIEPPKDQPFPCDALVGVMLHDYQKVFYNAMREAQKDGRKLFLMSGRWSGKREAVNAAKRAQEIRGVEPAIIFSEYDLATPPQPSADNSAGR